MKATMLHYGLINIPSGKIDHHRKAGLLFYHPNLHFSSSSANREILPLVALIVLLGKYYRSGSAIVYQ